MTKYILRRILQSIPTLIGISILTYVIIDLVPGNPLSQVTQDPNLTVEDRQRIFDAYGFNDPLHVKYLRWLIGEAPISFGAKPAWSIDLSNGQTVIVNSDRNDNVTNDADYILETRETASMSQDVTDSPVRRGRAGEREIVSADAIEIALAQFGSDVEVVDSGWLPYYGAIVLWQGRILPVYRGPEIIGEEVGDDLGALRGDFGTSFSSKRSTVETIRLRIGATFELGVISLVVGLILGLPIGVMAAVWHGTIFDQVTRIMAVLISSIPVFWLGLILLLIFGSWLQWLPMGNRFPLSFTNEYSIADRIKHLVLPVFTLSSFTIAGFSRFMRASVLDVLNEDYVRTARAKGVSDRRVWFIHALRNAMIPIATLLGPSIVGVLSGAVLTESIYSWPGMGLLVVTSVTQQDYPVIMAVVLLFSLLTVVGYLLSDVLYAVFDPRIRLS